MSEREREKGKKKAHMKKIDAGSCRSRRASIHCGTENWFHGADISRQQSSRTGEEKKD